jgi:hypothetical protein
VLFDLAAFQFPDGAELPGRDQRRLLLVDVDDTAVVGMHVACASATRGRPSLRRIAFAVVLLAGVVDLA